MPAPRPYRVLFVDDEPAVTRSLQLATRNESWDTVTAGSADQALKIMAEGPCDVVVSDERMPGMLGSDLLSIVRREYPDTIRILLTGQATVDAALKAVNQVQAYRFLLKPCPAKELVEVIKRAVEERAQRRSVDEWRRLQQVRAREELEADFRRGLSRMWMGFQRIVRARERTTFGFEALLRCDDEELNSVGALLAAADTLDARQALAATVRQSVADAVAHAPGETLIFVNVNPEDLADASLYAEDAPLSAHASRIVLEITEREGLTETTELADRIRRLRAIGYRIAVDDLGAGYSGLSSFVLLSPDFVKIDMTLVRNIHESHAKRTLVGSITQLCRSLGIHLIAEGVEIGAEAETVTDLGCDLLQGYYFGSAAREFASSSAASPDSVQVVTRSDKPQAAR